MRIKNLGKLFLSLLTGLLLGIGWTGFGIGWIVLIAFLPLIINMENYLTDANKYSAYSFTLFSFIGFLVWNIISAWWIVYSTVFGAVSVILLSSILMSFVMFLTYKSFEIFGRRIGYLVLVTNWIAFEYLIMNAEISWPWMILGNAFSNNISLIQWYEYTGAFGGSLWILIVNIIIFEIYRLFINKSERKSKVKAFIILIVIILFPLGFSLVRYYTYQEKVNPVSIVLIQPNIDPYTEKFTVPVEEQTARILKTAELFSQTEVDYFVAPETAISYAIWENDMPSNKSVLLIKEFLERNEDSKFIVGSMTRVKYVGGKSASETSKRIANTDDYYDLFNSSVQVDTSPDILVYHKSKLVSGIETVPYPALFRFAEKYMVKLGGIAGTYGTQADREVFKNKQSGLMVGVPICYESTFGEFISGFVVNGANILFVITNDGWWRDTEGHKKHMSLSRLRAVETRRSIARSANTGISCFINQRGDVIDKIIWGKRGAIKQSLNASNTITFYVQYGDYIARMALVISLLVLFMQITVKIRKRISRINSK